jgi:hypothetical protein
MRSGTAGLSWLAAMLLASGAAACSGGGEPPETRDPVETPTEVTGEACEVPAPPPGDREWGTPSEPALRQELLAMFDADQAERSGEVAANSDGARTDRLREIVDEHGWPTPRLVGEDGATAAWVIAQHSDHDVEFQREALDLMCAAAEAGEADPTELAYLVDRVAVNSGEPQVYGTQVGGCEDGRAVPRPIVDEQHVEERRAGAGLEPLEDYLDQFDEGCAGDPAS